MKYHAFVIFEKKQQNLKLSSAATLWVKIVILQYMYKGVRYGYQYRI